MSNAAIITIGDELISGFRLDTNSKWLSDKLTEINIQNLSILSVGDNVSAITDAMSNHCANRAISYVFITGGLGPTDDDCTYEAVKSFLKSNEYLDKAYLEELKNKFFHSKEKSDKLIIKQAMKLDAVQYLPNPSGTAIPMVFTKKKTTFFVLPGVPSELKKIYLQSILPRINQNNLREDFLALKFTGISESLLHQKIAKTLYGYHNTLRLSFLPNFTTVTLKIINLSNDKSLLTKIKKKILIELDEFYLGNDESELETEVLKILLSKKLTISIAESCTGGYISKLITDFSGSSNVFKGSIVAYSNEVKENQLNLSAKTLKRYGAVSFEVAEQMSRNIARELNTDIGMSVTGISGPDGGTELKPVGLVYISVTYLGKSLTKKFNISTSRNLHRLITASNALNMLRLILLDKINFDDKKK